jgi:hypothetical protein
MLEEMCRDRNIEINPEPFPIKNNFIYIKDQEGQERCWTIEEETKYGTYKIFCYDIISKISIKKIYIKNGKRYYLDTIYVPEGTNKMSLSFLEENFIGLLEDAERDIREKKEKTKEEMEKEGT